MKNENIHNNLPQKELRDFLSKYERKEGLLGGHSKIEDIEKEIKELQEKLKHIIIHQTILNSIRSIGWKLFDISDDIPYDKDNYFPFIGTDEEYNLFMKKLFDETILNNK